MADCEEVQFLRNGRIGRLVLNRPVSLNALTTAMIVKIDAVLDEWQVDAGIALVVESSSTKAFCAGGDIRQIRQNTIDGAHLDSEQFFASEYQLNARLAEFKPPLVSLIDGICMGGGLGLSVHGRFRVVTEKTVMAMPETAIGFFPDIGASYFLSRLPGALGTFLGLTGYRMDAADALYTGLATHYVSDPLSVAPALDERAEAPIDEVLRSLAPEGLLAPSRLAENRREIDWCFGAPTLAGIFSRLHQSQTPWARETVDGLTSVSPQSLEVTLAVLTRGKQLGLPDCLTMELDVATHLARTHDFVEGVRAGLVDKDNSPHWRQSQFSGFDSVGKTVWKGLL